MLIKILGTRGEIEARRRGYTKHSGILIDNKILIDVGEKEYLKYKPDLVFITHLHPDHAFFVSGKEKLKTTIPFYAPEGSKKLEAIKIVTKPVHKGDYLITPIPTVHSVKVKSQGYLIETGKKRIFYSSDIVTIQKKFLKKLSNLDLVITEGSFIRRGGVIRKDKNGHLFGHAGIPDLVKLFKPFTHRIVFLHFGTWFMKNISAGREKIKALEDNLLRLDIAHDGKEYKV